jgi:hypothetical protein
LGLRQPSWNSAPDCDKASLAATLLQARYEKEKAKYDAGKGAAKESEEEEAGEEEESD